jgi:hypothetical protein
MFRGEIDGVAADSASSRRHRMTFPEAEPTWMNHHAVGVACAILRVTDAVPEVETRPNAVCARAFGLSPAATGVGDDVAIRVTGWSSSGTLDAAIAEVRGVALQVLVIRSC